mmetsp:Transcript_3365/g.6590  ORF Transcript_3365/g.6590 Transcript_3365/m.6590 type:complete len:522 (-) Transcript_3365:72-1637(-)
MAKRVLFAGQCDGHFDILFGKISALLEKQKFDLLLCGGDMFGSDRMQAMQKLIQGEVKAPLPTYFCGPCKEGEAASVDEIGNNLNMIVGSGMVTIEGLEVAIVGVTSNGDIVFPDDQHPSTVDVLLTPAWPKAVAFGAKMEGDGVEGKDKWGSVRVQQLARRLCPRYHIAAGQNLFFKRPPFQSESGVLTRFVGLANVSADSAPNKKFLHALALKPMATLSSSDVSGVTPDTTPNPYSLVEEEEARRKQATTAARDRFSGSYGSMPKGPLLEGERREHRGRDDRPMKRQRHDDDRRGRQQPKEVHPLLQRMDECWFCLASPKVEKHLLISIGDESYIAMAKGPLTPEHVVVLPIAHCSSLLDASSDARQEIEKVKEGLEKAYASRGLVPVIMERFGHTRGNHHAHLQVIGVKSELSSSLLSSFEAAFAAKNLSFTALPGWMAMGEIVKGGPYFYLEIGGRGRYVCPLGNARLSVQIGREVIAELMGEHKKADWKECVTSPKEEKETALSFRSFFKAFDPLA